MYRVIRAPPLSSRLSASTTDLGPHSSSDHSGDEFEDTVGPGRRGPPSASNRVSPAAQTPTIPHNVAVSLGSNSPRHGFPPASEQYTVPDDVLGYDSRVSMVHVLRHEPLFDVLNGAAMVASPAQGWLAPPDTQLRMCTPSRWWGKGDLTRGPPNNWRLPGPLTRAEMGNQSSLYPAFEGTGHVEPGWYHGDNDDYTNLALQSYVSHLRATYSAAMGPVASQFSVAPHPDCRPPRIFGNPQYHPGHRMEVSYAVHLGTRMVFLLLTGSAQRVSIFEEYEGYCYERLGNIVLTGFCGPYQGFFMFRMRTRNQASMPFRLEHPRYILLPRECVVEEALWPSLVTEGEVMSREWRTVERHGREEHMFDQSLASGKGTSYSGQFDVLELQKSQEYLIGTMGGQEHSMDGDRK